jgi:phage shock protein C
MQRIIQINIAGRVLPIEEDAYQLLHDYINSLECQFRGDDGKEIIEDIENRISELFSIRLQSGAQAIDRNDVRKVIETLGSASDLNDGANSHKQQAPNFTYGSQNTQQNYTRRTSRLYRDPYDKVIGGVCSGLSHYFDVDPVIIRLIMAVLFLTFGIGLIAYIIAWAIIPVARSREELCNMNGGQPVTFHEISRNVQGELQDLKKRGEQMSRELRDFFSKKK